MPAKFVLKSICELNHKGLIHYLESRGIPLQVAKKYIQQTTIKNLTTNKSFYTLCTENEGKGFELRNRVFKGSISSKSITFIRGAKFPIEEIHVFEGFMDFLSAVSQHSTQAQGKKFNWIAWTKVSPQVKAKLKQVKLEAIQRPIRK